MTDNFWSGDVPMIGYQGLTKLSAAECQCNSQRRIAGTEILRLSGDLQFA